MKIGIITHPLFTNYGGLLQNYALQTVLKKLGHEPITLREASGYQGWTTFRYICNYPFYAARRIVYPLIGRKYSMPESIWAWRKRVSGMDGFVQRNINCTKPLTRITLNTIRKYGIEEIVVGSDQVWRPMLKTMIPHAFCGFAKDSNIPRLSYAASFGVDNWEYSKEQTDSVKGLVKKFKAVSVREESGVVFCKNYLDVEAQWVLDPTMLLTKEDYSNLCNSIQKSKDRYVFAYLLGKESERIEMAKETAKQLGFKLKIVSIGNNVKSTDTVEKWLSDFRDADYIITDSFHGTVFSLIFQKNFMCFYHKSGGVARMDGLRRITGLEDRFIEHKERPSLDDINYSRVSERIGIMRTASFDFLKENI